MSNMDNSVGCVGCADYEAAKNYDKRRFRSRRMKRVDERERAFAGVAFKMAGESPDILDVPCGNGRFYHIFSKAHHLTMVDYSEDMLKACKEKYGEGNGVRFVQADIASLPLEDGFVDMSFCMRLFHHMKTDEIRLAALRELTRVSRKYVALSFYNRDCLRYFRKRLLAKKISGYYVSFSHLMRLAGQAGLACVYRWPRINVIEQQCVVVLEKSR